jgi:hypothetical protein
MLLGACLLAGTPAAHADQAPFGALDALNTAGGSGWAYDADAGLGALDVHIYVDGALFRIVRADNRRDDLVSAGIAPNAEHGFQFDLGGLAPGPHVVNAYAINVGNGGSNPDLSGSPATVLVTNVVPVGALDFAGPTGGSGWAFDADSGGGGFDPIAVHVYIDDRFQAAVSAEDDRADLIAAGVAPNAPHGFHFALSGLTPGTHRLDVYAIDAAGGTNSLILNVPRFITVPVATTDRGWNPGMTQRRAAYYQPWRSDTFFESCPDDPDGCYPGVESGFFTLSPGVGEDTQPCRANTGETFATGASGLQPCPFWLDWDRTSDGRPMARLTADTYRWSTSYTPAIYVGFHENLQYPPYYYGGEDPATIDRLFFSVDMSAWYAIPVEPDQNSQVRYLVGTTWYVPAADRSIVLELNIDAVSHMDPSTGTWNTSKRAEVNPYCPSEWLCIYLGSRYWGLPTVLNGTRSLSVNWAEIARSLQASGELTVNDVTTGRRVDAIGAYPVTVYTGIETLGNVGAVLEVSRFRQSVQ